MEILFLIGQYQLHLINIGYTYVIHHTYHTLGSLIPNVWYVLYSLYGSLFTPHVVLPKWGKSQYLCTQKITIKKDIDYGQ